MPHLMVVLNDMCAYIFGIFLGKTPLIKISPKKTWEGFLGGIVGTFLISIISVKFFSRYSYLTCPEYDLRFQPFIYNLNCTND